LLAGTLGYFEQNFDKMCVHVSLLHADLYFFGCMPKSGIESRFTLIFFWQHWSFELGTSHLIGRCSY
jgi:hypothetical protein